MTLQLTRLTPAIGAQVQGVDLASPLDDSRFDEIRQALLEHQVLFFRNQDLNPVAQRSFAARFGELHTHPIYPGAAEAREVMVLDSHQVDLADNAIWHTDVTFHPTPPLGAVLAAKVLPPLGGDTLWASGTAAYDALDDRFKARLEGLTAVHDFVKGFPLSRFGTTPAALERWEATRRSHPPVTHPVVRTHPVTGRKSLFISGAFTTHINEVLPLESDALISLLMAHATRPEFSVRWRWQPGDVALWDNRCTQHYAVDDYRPAHRVMHRATIIGDRPR